MLHFCHVLRRCCVCVCIGGVLSYKYKYIYFALQKNNKKNKHEINDSRGMLFRCRLAVCSFSSALTLHNKRVRAHTHTHVYIDLQGPALLRGHRSTGAVRGFRPWDREDVGLSPRSSHSSVFVTRGPKAEPRSERVDRRRPPSQEGHVTWLCACGGLACVSVCVGDNCLKNTI